MMKKRLNRKGFTLAEVLVVVAIVVVLAAVGAVALVSHARTMQQLEMDGNAKEIFVAAQNHLTMAEGQGYLGKTEDAAFGTLAEDDIYYFVVGTGTDPNNKDLVLSQMLPFAAVDETVRLGGSYIIRYQRSTGTVLDVFYSSKGTRYSYDFSGTGSYASVMALRDVGGADHKKDRRNVDGKVLGWYGGAEAATLNKGETLEPPMLEIINAEYLKVIVHDYNESKNSGNNTVQLIVTGQQSKVQRVFMLKGPTSEGIYQANPGSSNRIYYTSAAAGDYEILLDSVTGQDKDRHFTTVTTGENKDYLHFSSLSGFIPGENLELRAVALNNEVLTNVAESPVYTANSLFAQGAKTGGTDAAPEFTVGVSNFRHLINLEKTLVSGLNITVKAVDQLNDLVWQSTEAGNNSFLTKTGAAGITMADGVATTDNCFLPVWLNGVTYRGGGHSVSNLIITAGSGIPATRGKDADATSNDLTGLFGSIDGGSVADLNLIDFNITGGAGDTGALAGKVTGSATISGVLVHNSKTGDQDDSAYAIVGTGAVGGLVGSLDAATVNTSAAAVYVSGGSSVGGLIGKAEHAVSISDSYSGGHTYDKKYQETATGDGRVNVVATGIAGGLIGDASASTLTLSYSYSTASSSGATAGGLIGKGGSGTVSYCYATGLVLASDAAKKGAFIGDGAGSLTLTTVPDPDDDTKTIPTNYYLESVSENASQPELRLVGAFAGDKNYPNFLIPTDPTDQRRPAVTYDTKLSARYDFPTISQLHAGYSASSFAASFTSVHYGDWYLPNMEILYYNIINDNTLYTEITLKEHTRLVTVAVYGETSKAAKAFLFEVSEDKSSVSLIDMGTLVGNDITWTGAPAADANLPAFGISGTDKKKVTVTMDDITTEKKHFASIFPNLFPGENITVLAAGGNCGWPELQTLRQKTYPADMEGAGRVIALSDNSIFAKPANLKNATVNYSDDTFNALLANDDNAEIINIRHLQNLDTAVSNVNADSDHKTATSAKLMNDINWTNEVWKELPAATWWLNRYIYEYDSTTFIQKGHFNGIVNTYLTGFNGNDKTIKGMVIGNTFGAGVGYAGFFRRVDNATLLIEKLHLDSPSITAQSNDAGAFIGYNNGAYTTLNTVLAEGDLTCEIKAPDGAAGGLVGGSNRTLHITNSAASMLVTAKEAAGGLVGYQIGGAAGKLEIKQSYVGGHTYGGVYYINADAGEEAANPDVDGVDQSSDERWNIISTSGAAGGLLGSLGDKADLEIEQSFNAASVYSGALTTSGAGGLVGVANGTISKLELVYVVAPVSEVKEIKVVSGTLDPEPGNAGSVIGISANTINANNVDGSGVYFLPNVYATPMPTMVETGVSNIKTIGDGTLNNIRLAYYYVKAGQDNAILPYVHTSVMEQQTDSFDTTLGEYPFAIWTRFAFDGKNILHFYGDWQPSEKGPTVHLDVEFYTVLPEDEAAGTARVVKHLADRDQEIAVQIPYEGAAIQLPWPEDVFNYNFGDWLFYYGDQSALVEAGTIPAAADTSTTVFSKAYNGFNVNLPVTDYKKLMNGYKTTDENGEDHLHITLVSTYAKRDNPLYKLEFYDATFKTKPDGSEEQDGFESEPLTYQVLEPLPNDDPTLAKVNLNQLVEGKQPPTRNKAGFRFLGWYLKNGENYTPIYENTFDTSANSFSLVLKSANAAFKVEQNIQLYARYEAIPYRTINVTFVDGDGLQIPSVEPYEIRFEGDRGFKETVIPLPYTENVLYPDTEKTPVVTGTSSSDTVVWTLAGENPTVKIAIAPVTSVTDANREINCKVTYTVKADYTGYVVLYELLDTDAASAGTYSAGNSYIYPSDLTEDYLYGTTIVGYSPTVDVEEDARFENYLLTKQPEGFEISGARVVKQTGDNTFPVKYSEKYPTTLDMGTADETDDLNVTYLVVIQCRRVSSWLTFDTRGGGNIAPVKMVYGKPLNDVLKKTVGEGDDAQVIDNPDYKPTYTSYTFQKWVYVENGEEKDAAGAKMPGHDLQLIAKREGAPVKFTVLIMEQNANDDGYTVGAMYTQYTKSGSTRDMKANAGSDVRVSMDHDAKTATLTWKDGTSDETTTYVIDSLKQKEQGRYFQEYHYFHLRDEVPYNVSVSDDGSTAVKIYLDRNYYSVWFLMGKATGGTINTKQGYFDNELGTHELHQYTRLDGTTFWAYEDEDAGKPYGEESNKYFELDADETEVPLYKPEGVYTPYYSTSVDVLYGVVGEYYDLLDKVDDYNEVSRADWNTTDDYFGKVNEQYVPLTKDNWTKKAYYYNNNNWIEFPHTNNTYDAANDNDGTQYGIVNNTIQELTYFWGSWYSGWFAQYSGQRYKINSDGSGKFYFTGGSMYDTKYEYSFTWRNGSDVYQSVISTDQTISNNDTASYPDNKFYTGGTVWKKNGVTYGESDTYSRADYPADGATYKESELVQRGTAFYYRDGNGNLVAVNEAGTETTSTYKIKGSNVDYTGTVYFFVIVDNPVHLDVNEFVAGTNAKYYVSTYSGTTCQWSNERQVVTTGNTNPFSVIPSANLRLVDESNSNYIAFYYSICDRYGASIKTDWPDVIWLSGHNIGVLNLQRSSGPQEFKFTSWLFPNTSRYYYLHSSTMTSIKGPYASMSEELILKRNSSNSTTFNDVPDDGSGNTPSVTMIGRYRDTPNWWNYVIHFGKGGKNPSTPKKNTAADWRTENVHVYSDGPSGNQNPITYDGYTCVEGPTDAQNASNNSWRDIHYYYVPNLHYIHFYAKLDANKAFAPNGAFVEINTKNAAAQTTNDAYFYDTPLNIADAYSAYIEERVPTGYEFKGWFTDSVGEAKFEFKTTDLMPDGDLMLYAIITPVDKTVTFTLTKPADAAGTVMWAKANETDPDDTDSRVFANVPHNSTLVSRIDEFVTAHGGAKFEPVLEGYVFTGWVEEGTTTAFAPSQQIIKTYTLVPTWDPLPPPEHKTVTVNYVQQADPTAAVHDPTTVDVIKDDTYKFTAQSVNGYKPETSYYYETIDDAWLEDHKVAGTENQYEVTFYYIPADNTWTYTVQYNLYLTPVNGGAAAEIPLQTGTETSSSNFAAVSFFTLPDSMKGYKVANLKLYEGSTLADSTTDPIIFVKKAENVTLVVNVVPDDTLFLQGEVVRTYNAQPQGVESEFESSLPTLPANVAFVRTVNYTYGGNAAKPTNVGAYQVGVTVTVTYNGVVYFYWESANASTSRPDMVLYIDPCDVIVTSKSVTNVFMDTTKNQKDKADGKLPGDADLRNIVQNLTAGLAKNTNVEIGDSLSTEVLAKLQDELLISPSADAFRRAASKGPEDSTTNTFYCEMSDSADNANFNFYKVYGKLYIWEDLDAYNRWKNPGE